MTVRGPRYSGDEFAQRGEAIYAQNIRSQVEGEHPGRVVAIDIETGAWALGDDVLAASEQVYAQHPDAQIWVVRVGQPALHRFGHWASTEASQ